MRRTYKLDRTHSEVEKTLISLIESKSENNFKTHLKHGLASDNANQVIGSHDRGRFSFWVLYEHRWLSSRGPYWIYPIVNIKTEGSNPTLLVFSHEWNPVAKVIVSILFLGLLYGLTDGIIIQENMETQFVILRSLITVVIMAVFAAPILMAYHVMTKVIRQGILKKLKEL